MVAMVVLALQALHQVAVRVFTAGFDAIATGIVAVFDPIAEVIADTA